MPLHILDNNLWFPPVEDALEDGLLAAGGSITVERLLLAYRNGIFPWYDGPVPLWWSPDPRFVLFTDELYISKSMQQVLTRGTFQFTIDKSFAEVIKSCKHQTRKGQDGTWITDEIEQAYNQLHALGHAHSAEAWDKDELCGGLYGVRMGNIFFGESMFSTKSNASKYALIKFVQQLKTIGVELIDCQVYTPHLESLGARMIPRSLFNEMLLPHRF